MVGYAQEDTEIMGELEAVGAVYRRREGRGVRFFVIAARTHLAGAPGQGAGPGPQVAAGRVRAELPG